MPHAVRLTPLGGSVAIDSGHSRAVENSAASSQLREYLDNDTAIVGRVGAAHSGLRESCAASLNPGRRLPSACSWSASAPDVAFGGRDRRGITRGGEAFLDDSRERMIGSEHAMTVSEGLLVVAGGLLTSACR